MNVQDTKGNKSPNNISSVRIYPTLFHLFFYQHTSQRKNNDGKNAKSDTSPKSD